MNKQIPVLGHLALFNVAFTAANIFFDQEFNISTKAEREFSETYAVYQLLSSLSRGEFPPTLAVTDVTSGPL